MATQNPFDLPLRKLARLIVNAKPELIDALGVEALKFIDDNFAKQGFQGATFEPWPKRKKADKKRPGRKILVDTANLRRSFTKTDHADHTTISTDVPYAQTHNEGLTINHPSRSVILNFRKAKGGRVRFSKQSRATMSQRATIGAHDTKMPQRRFIGPSPVLNTAAKTALAHIIINKLNTL